MTAKTLEKVPVNLGGFVHPVAESVYSVDDIASSLPTSVAIFPNTDLGTHYEQINMAAGKVVFCFMWTYQCKVVAVYQSINNILL